MNKFIILTRVRHIRDMLDGEMRKLSGQLRQDAQEDIRTLDSLIVYYTETYKESNERSNLQHHR